MVGKLLYHPFLDGATFQGRAVKTSGLYDCFPNKNGKLVETHTCSSLFYYPKPWGFMIQFDLRIFLVKNHQLVSEIPKTKGMIRIMHPKKKQVFDDHMFEKRVGSTTNC